MTKNIGLVSKYVKTGQDCPICGSNIDSPREIGKPKYHGDLLWDRPFEIHQHSKCPACGAEWIDVYRLADIIQNPEVRGK